VLELQALSNTSNCYTTAVMKVVGINNRKRLSQVFMEANEEARRGRQQGLDVLAGVASSAPVASGVVFTPTTNLAVSPTTNRLVAPSSQTSE